MTNIFYEHYKKRDGALYKDLAFLNHKERIKMLNKCIERYIKLIRIDAIKWNFCVSAIGKYQRLKKYCEKNKNIKAVVYE